MSTTLSRISRLFLLVLGLSLLLGCNLKRNQPETPKKKVPLGSLVLLGAPENSLLVVDESYKYPLSTQSRLRLSAGEHRISIECDGFFPLYQTIKISVNEEVTLQVSLRPYLPD